MHPKQPNSTLVRDVSSLGDQVRAARKSQNLTLTQAAMLCGVGVRFLSELENGKPTAEVGKVLHVLRQVGLELRLSPRGSSQDRSTPTLQYTVRNVSR